MLNAGDRAPDFEGKDCQGKPVRLRDYRGRSVVLFFFPKAFSVHCTEEVRHFRDNQARLRALGAELIGVSVDSFETQCAFAKEEKVEFPLLGDADRTLSELFGVLWPVVRVDRRVTFLIDPDGAVEEVVKHETKVHRHLDDVVAALERRRGAKAPPAGA
ncbi:MAG TPA: peroxiredoxin [Myxococcaceae bacterium]|jgi:peroxiredoxin Q/BCP|nr:peroxiredoxin [Myxococcaceae bacterium]